MVWTVAGCETHLIVCCGGLIWGGSYGLPLWSGSTALSEGLTEKDGLLWRLKIKNIRSWGNRSEKALNASESYAKRNEKEKIRKYFIFQILSCPGKLCKDSVKLIQGCADDLFESFPFVLRIVYCNVRHHGNNPGSAAIYSRERSRVM